MLNRQNKILINLILSLMRCEVFYFNVKSKNRASESSLETLFSWCETKNKLHESEGNEQNKIEINFRTRIRKKILLRFINVNSF